MSTFLGIGAGPIQTGIFVSGAARGDYSRIVLADVDEGIVAAVRRSGAITVNTAQRDSVETGTYDGIEIYNPLDKDDAVALQEVAADATAICTALPSTAFYRHIAPWLGDAFRAAPDARRYVYTAENSTTAADELREAVGEFPATYYLDSVIGKMSKVFTVDDCDLPVLATGLNRGHLVEAFNEIYTGTAPGIEDVGIEGLYPKPNLLPFEEAKLYGHNTVHFALGLLLQARGASRMDQAADHPDILAAAHRMMADECGTALCRKHGAVDLFFEPEAFSAFAEALVTRMVSPTLQDDVERILRDMERKMGWNDRLVGGIRLCLDQGVEPVELLSAAGLAAKSCFGSNQESVREGLASLWCDAPRDEAGDLVDRISRSAPPSDSRPEAIRLPVDVASD